MKCPKCGFISFDHNHNCSKCKKSLNEQAGKMNLPRYEPAPPFLLGSLLGEDGAPMVIEMADLPDQTDGNHQTVGPADRIDGAASFDREADMEISLDDVHSDEDALEQFSLPGLAEAVAEMETDSAETDTLSIDFENFSPDESIADFGRKEEEPDESGYEPKMPDSGETRSSESDHESDFEFLDLSSDVEEHRQDDPAEPDPVSEDHGFELPYFPWEEETGDSAGTNDEPAREKMDEMPAPFPGKNEEPVMLIPSDGEDEEGISFDMENYSAPVDNIPDPNEELRESSREDEGIPFDPEALDLKFDRQVNDEPSEPAHLDDIDFRDIPGLELEKTSTGEEPVKEDFTIVLDDLDFEVLESDEGEEKK